MRCDVCGGESPRGHRFCGGCAAPLPATCGACGALAAPGARFCGECAAPLGLLSTSGFVSRPAPGSLAPRESRRHVTILFTDLSGFTELSTRLDAEDLHVIAQAYFDRVEAIVTSLGGSVERYVGDAIMAVFGAPIAHDDDVLRAVRAGLEVKAAMPALSARFAQELACVVGIASGEVVVTEPRPGYAADVAVVGSFVNLASRIESIGRPGDVLVSDDVYREVAQHVAAESLGAHSLKGIAEKVTLWRVHRLAEQEGVRTRLVGRGAELALLARELDRVVQEGKGSVILLRGEPGMGKTSLLHALSVSARERGYAAHRGTFLDFGLHRGAEGLRALACSLLGVDPAVEAGVRRDAVEEFVASGRLDEGLAPMLFELAAVDQTDATRTLFEAADPKARERGRRAAIAALVGAGAARSPLLLVIEDIHWADPLDVDRLADLAATCRDLPVVLAMASRTAGDPIDAAWSRRAGGPPSATLDLAPLGAEEMLELGAGLPDVQGPILAECIERSGGNPMFLEQLIRHVLEGGHARLPGSIKSLVLARMDRLDWRDRWALQAASVLGKRFQLAALRYLLDDKDYDPVALLGAALVRGVGREFLFAHALIQEAAYGSLLRRKSRELHGQSAEWYAQRDLALRAQHLDRADDARAPRAYLEAACLDTATGDYARARAELDRGAALARLPADRHALALQRGQLLHDVGEVPAAEEAYRAALDLSEDDVGACRARIGLAACMRLSDDLDRAREALTAADEIASRRELHAELARIAYLRGSICFPLGDIDGCLREHGRALEHARRAGLPDAEANALSGLGDAYYASGKMRTAHRYLVECLALATAHGLGRIEAANRFMVATVRMYLLELEGALADARRSADLASKVGHQRAEVVSRLTAGWILVALHQLGEARREAEEGIRVTEALGAPRFRPFLMETLARVELAEGDREAATRTAAEAMELVRQGDHLRFIGPWVLGTLAMCSRDRSVRHAALAEGERLLASGCVGHNHYGFHAHAIEACLDDGDPSGVLRWADALERYTRPEPNPWADFQIARGRALARCLAGGGDDATRAELLRLRGAAEAAGLLSALPSIVLALEGLSSPGSAPADPLHAAPEGEITADRTCSARGWHPP